MFLAAGTLARARALRGARKSACGDSGLFLRGCRRSSWSAPRRDTAKNRDPLPQRQSPDVAVPEPQEKTQETEPAKPQPALALGLDSFRSALDGGPLGVWSWDLRSNQMTWSSNLPDFHGMPEAQLDGTFSIPPARFSRPRQHRPARSNTQDAGNKRAIPRGISFARPGWSRRTLV